MSESCRKGILILGYGNPGRQDDGLGPALTETVECWGLPDVAAEVSYQLNIEDAAVLADYEKVLFVDASRNGPEPYSFGEVKPASTVTFTTHSVPPESVLAICDDHFGPPPPAWALGIRGYEFGFGEELTPRARANLDKAIAFVQSLLRTWKES